MTAISQGKGVMSSEYSALRYLYYSWSGIALFEGELRLKVYIIKLRSITKIFLKKYNWYAKRGDKVELCKMFS